MFTKQITPRDKAHWLDMRRGYLNSTEISALFNLSPYLTAFELQHRKMNKVNFSIEENERMRWGSRLESAIAAGIAEDNSWVIKEMKDYFIHDQFRIASSFDYALGADGILEIKNVDSLAFKNGWKEDVDGNVEAPLHIEMQVQWQMMISGRSHTYIGALVGGNKVQLILREADFGIHKAMLDKARWFWDMCDRGEMIKPDFERDAEFISKLYQSVEDGKTIESNSRIDFLAEDYKNLSSEIKELEAKRDAVKAELLTLIGDAEKCLSDRFTLSASVTPPAQISYMRKEFRNFRISWKKIKGE